MKGKRRREWMDFLRGVAMACVFSIPFGLSPVFPHVGFLPKTLGWGIIFGSVIYTAKGSQRRIRFRSFAISVLLQTTYVLAATVLAFGAGFLFMISLELGHLPWHPDVVREWKALVMKRDVGIWIGWTFIGVTIFSGIFQISRKLGPGVLRNWLLGKYHEPREETRIFMFLDMKDSTTLAERLGALKFSALVRDFFSDLTEPTLETRAEISHYIGDEAVISWRLEKGLREDNCLRLFFQFQEQIESRAHQYRERYGIVPGFKAGAHLGPVVATEVGHVKSEIVFHGDVLNTAARIQGMCSQLDAEFLISGELAAALLQGCRYTLQTRGRHLLKGKEHDVEIIAVTASPEHEPSTMPTDATEAKAR